jgi:hypothetical protein
VLYDVECELLSTSTPSLKQGRMASGVACLGLSRKPRPNHEPSGFPLSKRLSNTRPVSATTFISFRRSIKALDKAAISPLVAIRHLIWAFPHCGSKSRNGAHQWSRIGKRIQDFHDKGSLYSLLRGDRGIANEMKARRIVRGQSGGKEV